MCGTGAAQRFRVYQPQRLVRIHACRCRFCVNSQRHFRTEVSDAVPYATTTEWNRYQQFETSAVSVGGFSQWCSSCNKTTDPHSVYNAWLPDGTPVFGQPAAMWCASVPKHCSIIWSVSGNVAGDPTIIAGIHKTRGFATEQTVVMGFGPQRQASERRRIVLRVTCAPLQRKILRGRCLSQLMVLTTVRPCYCLRMRACVR